MQQVRLIVSGTVQGVFFRASTRDQALRLGLGGTVRNLPDGRVEIVAAGPEDKLQQLIAWAKRGPSRARVTDVQIDWEAPHGDWADFQVIR